MRSLLCVTLAFPHGWHASFSSKLSLMSQGLGLPEKPGETRASWRLFFGVLQPTLPERTTAHSPSLPMYEFCLFCVFFLKKK